MLHSKIHGTWKLKSFELESLEGALSSWGKNTHGLLIYSPSGYMSVSINKDVVKESENEIEDIFDSVLFYSGTFKIENDIIHHQVTEASNPARIGKDMIRYAELTGDILKLSTGKESFGRAILVWQKLAGL